MKYFFRNIKIYSFKKLLFKIRFPSNKNQNMFLKTLKYLSFFIIHKLFLFSLNFILSLLKNGLNICKIF